MGEATATGSIGVSTPETVLSGEGDPAGERRCLPPSRTRPHTCPMCMMVPWNLGRWRGRVGEGPGGRDASRGSGSRCRPCRRFQEPSGDQARLLEEEEEGMGDGARGPASGAPGVLNASHCRPPAPAPNRFARAGCWFPLVAVHCESTFAFPVSGTQGILATLLLSVLCSRVCAC